MKKCFALVACLVVLSVAGAAWADTLVYTHSEGGESVKYRLDGDLKSTTPSMFFISDKTTGDNFNAFCLDVTKNIVKNTDLTYAKAPDARAILGGKYDFMEGMIKAAYPTILANGANADLYKRVLQLAVWEAMEESSSPYSLSSGDFYVSSADPNYQALRGAFDSLYAAALGGGLKGHVELSVWLNQGNYQNLVQFTYTPIPGAVWLLGSGLAGLMAMKRRGAKALAAA